MYLKLQKRRNLQAASVSDVYGHGPRSDYIWKRNVEFNHKCKWRIVAQTNLRTRVVRDKIVPGAMWKNHREPGLESEADDE